MSTIKKKKSDNSKYLIIIAIIVAIMIITIIVILNIIKPKEQENNNTNSEVTSETTEEEIPVEDELKKMNEMDRIKRYIGIFFEDIENEDYQKAYNVLNEEFKNTYFPSLEEFENYVKKHFKSSTLGLTYDNVERLGNNKTGNMYIVWIYTRNLLELKKSDEESDDEDYTNFVVIENDYNNYEMSFSVKD